MIMAKVENTSILKSLVQFVLALTLLSGAEVLATTVLGIKIPLEIGWFWLLFSSFYACRNFAKTNHRQMVNRERINFATLAAVSTVLVYLAILIALTKIYGGILDSETLLEWAQPNDFAFTQTALSATLSFLGQVISLAIALYFAAMAFSHPKLFLRDLVT